MNADHGGCLERGAAFLPLCRETLPLRHSHYFRARGESEASKCGRRPFPKCHRRGSWELLSGTFGRADGGGPCGVLLNMVCRWWVVVAVVVVFNCKRRSLPTIPLQSVLVMMRGGWMAAVRAASFRFSSPTSSGRSSLSSARTIQQQRRAGVCGCVNSAPLGVSRALLWVQVTGPLDLSASFNIWAFCLAVVIIIPVLGCCTSILANITSLPGLMAVPPVINLAMVAPSSSNFPSRSNLSAPAASCAPTLADQTWRPRSPACPRTWKCARVRAWA